MCRLSRDRGVEQRYLRPRCQVIDDGSTFALAADLDLPLFEAVSVADVDDALAVFHEQRLTRDIEDRFARRPLEGDVGG